MINISEIKKDKKKYLDLLLLADEQESMIDCYLNRGTMYVLTENDVKTICVVTDEGNRTLEIKNIATKPEHQRRGYGRKMIAFLEETYRGIYRTLKVGTGDSPYTVPFYESCGFRKSYTVKNFFTKHYDHPIFEGGKQLVDMVYFEKELPEGGSEK